MSINIKIKPDVAEITESTGVGMKTKVVSLQSLCGAFSSCAAINTGILPYGTRHYYKSDCKELIVMEFPESIRNVEFQEEEEGTFVVPVPRLLMAVTLLNRSDGYSDICHTSMAALREPLAGFPSSIYRFPFCNVSDYVCWGDQELPRFRMNAYQGLDSLVNLFFSSPFNGDLDGNFDTSVFEDMLSDDEEFDDDEAYTYQLFEHLDGKDKFPNSLLVRMGDYARWIEEEMQRSI